MGVKAPKARGAKCPGKGSEAACVGGAGAWGAGSPLSSELGSVTSWEGSKIKRWLLEGLQNSGRSCVTSTGGSGRVFPHCTRLVESRGIAREGWGDRKR